MSDEEFDTTEFEAEKLLRRAELTVAADVSAIDVVVKRVLTLASDMGCAAGHEFEIETAIREALANAIVHGCKEDSRKTVSVSVSCDAERGMIIVVRDPGDGFDPAKIPNPVIGEQVYAEGGRGIYLINRLMDEVRVRRGRGTEIWMRKG